MKQIIAFALLCLLYSCSSNPTSLISGTADGMTDGTQVFLAELGKNNKRIPLDTATVTNGKFAFVKKLPQEKAVLLLNAGAIQSPIILLKDSEPAVITIYKDSITSSQVTGSLDNVLFNDYRNTTRLENNRRLQIKQDSQKAQRETDGVMVTMLRDELTALDAKSVENKKEIITNNPGKMVALMALSDLVNEKVITLENTEKYYNGLSADLQESSMGDSVKNYIAQLKSQRIASKVATVGNKAPEFTAKTPEGKDLSLKETLGKYTIIDFWASWCGPCRRENPNVVNVYNEYHDKGLNIISVSLDRPNQEERWKRAIKQDKMDWYHVSNMLFWQDPIPKSYGVRAIPATFLLDENGVIVAKNLRGPALGAKMKELLGKN